MTQENASESTAPGTVMTTVMTEPPNAYPVLPPSVPTPKDVREMLERIKGRAA